MNLRRLRPRRLSRADLGVGLGATALLVACTGVTPAEAVRAAKRAIDADRVNGIAASKVPTPGKLLPLGADGRFPSAVLPAAAAGQAGPRGPRGPEGPSGVLGAAGGDLAGDYPNPTLRPGAVDATEVVNRYVFRAYAIAQQTTVAAGEITVKFGGETFDPANVFDPGPSRFTAPVGGYYRFEASVELTPTPTSRSLIQIASTRDGQVIRGTDLTTQDYQQALAMGLMRLEKGDSVDVRLYTTIVRTVPANIVTTFSGSFVAPL